jgi:5'-3' exonuclease
VTTLLLDSDILAYRESSAGEVKVDWDGDGDIDQIPEDFERVCEKVDATIAGLIRKLNAGRVIVCLSCDRADNWRKDFYPAYKENRAGAIKPLHLVAAKQYMAREYETYQRPRLEADDVMGILSTHPKLVPGKRIIVSEDKDMKTVPGWLFNPDKHQLPVLVTPGEGAHFHMMQTLMGDQTDGYPGCPGIGPKKAEAALLGFESYREMWPAVVAVFESRSLDEAAALVQARIARICQHTDFDYQSKTVIPWSPT